DALTPEAPGHDYGVYVRSVSSDNIVLTSKEERRDTLRPGVAGLYWEAGYGLLGRITATSGLEVTRISSSSRVIYPRAVPGRSTNARR
ncbi:MAG: hypothetical protein WB239_09620, partial [Acidimicrobiia bacterium]